MGTLGGFPNPPTLWLRRAKLGFAYAFDGNPGLARRPGELAAGEHVQVEVLNRLAGFRTSIHHNTKPSFAQTDGAAAPAVDARAAAAMARLYKKGHFSI